MQLEVEYLSQEQLQGFEGYKVSYFFSNLLRNCSLKNLLILQYSCKDTNPISIYVMHPFWNKVIKVSIKIETLLKVCKIIAFNCSFVQNGWPRMF